MSRARGAAFGIGTFLLTLVALGFLVLPIVAIFARVPLHRLLDQLDDPVVRDAMVLTGTTNAIALAVILLVGTPAAYFLGTRRFRGRTRRDHAHRAAARAAADRRRHRPAGGVRGPHRPARRHLRPASA